MVNGTLQIIRRMCIIVVMVQCAMCNVQCAIFVLLFFVIINVH
jgi:hypothetical protein